MRVASAATSGAAVINGGSPAYLSGSLRAFSISSTGRSSQYCSRLRAS